MTDKHGKEVNGADDQADLPVAIPKAIDKKLQVSTDGDGTCRMRIKPDQHVKPSEFWCGKHETKDEDYEDTSTLRMAIRPLRATLYREKVNS